MGEEEGTFENISTVWLLSYVQAMHENPTILTSTIHVAKKQATYLSRCILYSVE